MYAGPGPASLSAAAVMWDSLAAELHAAAGFYRSVIAGLTSGRWLGPASLSMASALGPYVAWTAGVAARAAETASQATFAVEGYEAAFAMTVPPPVVAANRALLAALVATNFFGQNSTAIAATEAHYGEMWAQDAAAMYEYAANSATACELTLLTTPPEVVNPVGEAGQASAVANAAAAAGSEQLSLAGLVSSVPALLDGLASPLSGLADSSLMPTLATVPVYALPSYFMAAATPLYSMSSILGIAQTAQGLLTGAAAAAAQAVTEGAAGAVSSGAGLISSVGPGVTGSLGSAASLGPLSVPASWTSVIPAAHTGAVTALPNAGLDAANAAPAMLGAAPRNGTGANRFAGPRYGVVPTVMTRPPSAGYT
ncbi:putative PPE family protein PPE32 [Mycobacterium pseudokansasii]|uniref:Putative PPE family protein PPE32 n=2 Tax=Mycobacterium pseudokansasii TaxID=2341080 RepID=A0A498R2C4_9MYCO|nr:putative PPE family protein PPE32 [Mycobacterium pseudokansasii]VBA31630.1 putative PPE family protein PPE32 [Mycobacterium pseudokansasii]VBA54177.1 putative PPE family protein PPE32 [Mycobacterium pseudokansasii]